ncbi:MAG TPA: hypothetical protein PKC96_06065 [Bacilli bacterium]|nr:hypothetical protein [Bacilli bacterium]
MKRLFTKENLPNIANIILDIAMLILFIFPLMQNNYSVLDGNGEGVILHTTYTGYQYIFVSEWPFSPAINYLFSSYLVLLSVHLIFSIINFLQAKNGIGNLINSFILTTVFSFFFLTNTIYLWAFITYIVVHVLLIASGFLNLFFYGKTSGGL